MIPGRDGYGESTEFRLEVYIDYHGLESCRATNLKYLVVSNVPCVTIKQVACTCARVAAVFWAHELLTLTLSMCTGVAVNPAVVFAQGCSSQCESLRYI